MSSITGKSRLHRFTRFFIPQKGDGKREIIRKFLLIAALTVIICRLCVLFSYYTGIYENENENDALKRIYASASFASSESHAMSTSHVTFQSQASSVPSALFASSEATTGGRDILPEFTSLYRQNDEIKGWITIPKTNIDYPVVQAADNKKYLGVNFSGKAERHGTLFLDYRDTIGPLSQNLIIYGHNMGDGQMFGQLGKYERREGNDCVGFYNSSPLITFNTLYERSKWKIFAVFVTTANSNYPGSLYYLNTEFGGESDFNSFIESVRKRSFINTDVDVEPTDRLLTLSTCDYVYPQTKDGEYARLVVMARKVRSGESEKVASATKNAKVVFPDCYYKALGK